MRKALIGLLVAFVAAALLAGAVVAARPNQSLTFVAPLSGDAEVPSNMSRARGVAIFHLNADGTSLSYKLISSNIENITQAHIHCCTDPTHPTAGVVVWLYPEEGQTPILIPGRHDGVLATGTITASDVIGGLSGQLSALITEIQEGDAYVNVHTDQIPGGEIRGQLP